MDEVREVMRLHHYSLHTERSYSDWIRRFVKFHGMQSRDDLGNGEEKIESFLIHLAVNGNVAPSTQNQAMNAIVFLCRKVLKQPLDEQIDAVRAPSKRNVDSGSWRRFPLTRFVTVLRRIFCSATPTFEPFKVCWGIRIWKPRGFTPMC